MLYSGVTEKKIMATIFGHQWSKIVMSKISEKSTFGHRLSKPEMGEI